MTEAIKGQVDTPLQAAELVIEHGGWEKEVAGLETLADAICNNTIKRHEAGNSAIVILLSDNATIQKLNMEWRGQNKPTNVLSFPNNDPSFVLGDIAMAFEYCEAEAISQGKTLKNHFTHLLIHGVLHLLGYDHIEDAEAAEMESLEVEILRDFGIADPYLIIDNSDEEAEGMN